MNPIRTISSLAVCAVLMATAASADHLLNASFETGTLASWSTFGYGWRIVSDGAARTGDFALAVDNNLELDEGTWHGIHQDVPVTPRQSYSIGVYVKAENVRYSSAFLEVQWLNADGQMLHQVRSPAINRSQPYRLVQLKKTKAPVGAVTASIRGVFFMPGAPRNDQAVFFFDDFYIIPE